eukprot:gene21814-biopygen8687
MGPQPHTYGRGRGGAPLPSFRGRESALGFPPRPPNAPALQ